MESVPACFPFLSKPSSTYSKLVCTVIPVAPPKVNTQLLTPGPSSDKNPFASHCKSYTSMIPKFHQACYLYHSITFLPLLAYSVNQPHSIIASFCAFVACFFTPRLSSSPLCTFTVYKYSTPVVDMLTQPPNIHS